MGARRILITGAAGFVGASLARRLAADGHELHLLVRPGGDRWRLEGLGARVWEADMADAAAVEAAVAGAAPEWVFHMAAFGAYSWQTDVARIIDVNLRGTVHLVDACARRGCDAFVAAGSSSEYGYKDHAPSEDERLEPNSPYAVAKAAATHYACLAAREKGLPVRILRLYSVYGPWEDPRRLMPTLVDRGLQGELPPLVNPDVARDYVYAADVDEACVLAAAVPDQEAGAIYNVGSGVQTTIREVVAVARRSFGIAQEPAWGSMADRSWDTSVWVSDPRRIKERLGWSPRVALAEGLRLLAAWMSADPARRARYRRR